MPVKVIKAPEILSVYQKVEHLPELMNSLYESNYRGFFEALVGISSRTLSDKLRKCTENGLIDRIVVDGPPIRVTYRLTDHGQRAGRLLGPLVAYMKVHRGSVTQE